MNELTVKEMAQMLGDTWGTNKGDEFIRLFSKEAVINHPFFVDDEKPQTIVEVLNCNVKGTSYYEGYDLIKGNGLGVDDVIEMRFIDTGNNCGYIPKYQGRMIITAYIKDHLFTRFDVYGYDIVESEHIGKKFRRIEDIDVQNSYDLAELAGKAWEDNDMDLFSSLFTENGTIYHPLFNKPVNPYIVSDILNSPMEGISKLKNVIVITGNGNGEEDIIDMYFEETGTQLGYIPDQMGVLHMTGKIKDKRFTEFIVHNYTPAANIFKLDSATNKVAERVNVGKLRIAETKKEGLS
ncbi:MAG: hypothetical protein LBV33_00545 [Lachnospiraceae bacterium]|jgi:hypothetical protein|nr:hypothetical protein [Lachnospiraceae bacterium]